MPALRSRLARLAGKAAEPERPPLLFILSDDDLRPGGPAEAWEARYGALADRLRAEGRVEVTRVDFRAHR